MKIVDSYSSRKPIVAVKNDINNEERLESPLTDLANRLGSSNIATPTTTEPKFTFDIEDYDELSIQESVEVPTMEHEMDRVIENEEKGFFINNENVRFKSKKHFQSRRKKSTAAQVINFDIKCESPFKLEPQPLEIPYSPIKMSPLCYSSAINLANSSDEIELLGSSQDTINNNSNSSLKEEMTAKTQITEDSVYSSPSSPLLSDNEINEIIKCDGTDLDDIEFAQADISFNFNQMTPERKQSSTFMSDDFEISQENFGDQMKDLLFNEIKSESFGNKPSARKLLNMNQIIYTPDISKTKHSSIESLITTPERVCLANISNNFTLLRPIGPLKRLEPTETSPLKSAKKFKCEDELTKLVPRAPPPIMHQQLQHVKKPVFRKSVSVDEAALLFNDRNKTADFCYELCLPILTKSKHSDLKSITPETLKRLMNGEFNHIVASYKIIDCRYPYEFEGGHIRGAKNLYMENQIDDEFMKSSIETPHVDANGKRNIVIFHCEFSSERGPRQYRHLRSIDRAANAYPALQYPEIYLLEGGYKAFFESNKEYCEPQSYRLMIDPDFNAQYQAFRAKTKRSGILGVEASGRRLVRSRSRLAL